jgi:hypothetical protein
MDFKVICYVDFNETGTKQDQLVGFSDGCDKPSTFSNSRRIS